MNPTESTAADQYNDGNERDVNHKQSEPVESSEAIAQDPEVDAEAVQVLPGTGGPDDGGDTELDPADYHPEG